MNTNQEQPKALRLADVLDAGETWRWQNREAAAELRSQHEEIERLKAERGVLRNLLDEVQRGLPNNHLVDLLIEVDAAIAAVENKL